MLECWIMEKSLHITEAPELPRKTQSEERVMFDAGSPDGVILPERTVLKRSFGEKAFDWLTYGAWNHGVNLVFSAAITYWARATGAKAKMVSGLKNKGMGEGAASVLVDTFALSMGGNITALGVKPLEDRKQEITQRLNEKFSPEEKDAPLADQRQQTWFSILSGRASVLFGVGLAMMGLDRLAGEKTLSNGKKVSRLQLFEEGFGKKVTHFFGGKTHINGKQETRLFKINKVLSLELIAVTLGSIIFLGASKMLARKPVSPLAVDEDRFTRQRNHDIKQNIERPSEAIDIKERAGGSMQPPSSLVTKEGRASEPIALLESQLLKA